MTFGCSPKQLVTRQSTAAAKLRLSSFPNRYNFRTLRGWFVRLKIQPPHGDTSTLHPIQDPYLQFLDMFTLQYMTSAPRTLDFSCYFTNRTSHQHNVTREEDALGTISCRAASP